MHFHPYEIELLIFVIPFNLYEDGDDDDDNAIISFSVQELLKIKDELTRERDEKLAEIVKVRRLSNISLPYQHSCARLCGCCVEALTSFMFIHLNMAINQ